MTLAEKWDEDITDELKKESNTGPVIKKEKVVSG